MIKVIRSTKTGERLQAVANLKSTTEVVSNRLLLVDEKRTYQSHAGFGGALTEATTAVLKQMSNEQKRAVLEAYFGKNSLNYNLARITINSSDFGYGNYDYLDGIDVMLKSFTLKKEETRAIPALKEINAIRGEKIKLFASPWSPPAFMKTNKMMNEGGKLLREHYETWAKYFALYLKAMKNYDLAVDFISVQNEPEAKQRWESCLWTAEEEAIFIRDYLVPELKANKLDTKIFIWDHNRDEIVRRARITLNDPEVRKHVYGIAYHWYVSDAHHHLSIVHDMFPEKHLYFSEGCVEMANKVLVPLGETGSWKHGETYGRNIINDFNNYNEAFIDWNLVLDERGGPNHVNNFCEAPVMYDTKNKEVVYNPSFYFIAHFAKYIKVGAKRLHTVHDVERKFYACSYLNPDQKMVTVIQNEDDKDVDITLNIRGKTYLFLVKGRSINTLLEV